MTKDIKIEWCENFIKKTFEKKQCKGIVTSYFWELAEASGLWRPGTYGTPMSKALENLTTVEIVRGENNEYLYTVFRLV